MAVTSPYDGLTPEAIKAEMLAELMVKGSEIDHREGSYANTLVSVAAYQLKTPGSTSTKTRPSWA